MGIETSSLRWKSNRSGSGTAWNAVGTCKGMGIETSDFRFGNQFNKEIQ